MQLAYVQKELIQILISESPSVYFLAFGEQFCPFSHQIVVVIEKLYQLNLFLEKTFFTLLNYYPKITSIMILPPSLISVLSYQKYLSLNKCPITKLNAKIMLNFHICSYYHFNFFYFSIIHAMIEGIYSKFVTFVGLHKMLARNTYQRKKRALSSQ